MSETKTKLKESNERVTFEFTFSSVEAARVFQPLIEQWYDLNLEGGRQPLVDKFYEAFMVAIDNADPDIEATCLYPGNSCVNKADHPCEQCGHYLCMVHKDDHECRFKEDE